MFPVNSAEKSACREGIRRKIIKNTFIGGMVFHWRKLQRGYYFILCGGRGGYEEKIIKRESRSIDCAALEYCDKK